MVVAVLDAVCGEFEQQLDEESYKHGDADLDVVDGGGETVCKKMRHQIDETGGQQKRAAKDGKAFGDRVRHFSLLRQQQSPHHYSSENQEVIYNYISIH